MNLASRNRHVPLGTVRFQRDVPLADKLTTGLLMTIRLPLSQFFFLALFAVSTYASTANDLAVKLQKQLLASDAAEMQFTVRG